MSGTTGSSLAAPGSINDARTKAHLALGRRLGAIKLSPLLLYSVTGAPASALPFLAWQFDVLSPWWQLLAGPESQTAIIQNAVALHRYSGTVAAIEQIMGNLGFPVVTVLEGQSKWGGTQYPPSEGWAVFRVLVAKETGSPPTFPNDVASVSNVSGLISIAPLEEAGDLAPAPVTAAVETQAVAAIDFFKPQRSILDSLWFVEVPIAEQITLSSSFTALGHDRPIDIREFVTAPGWPASDALGGIALYNDHFYHVGITYGGSQPGIVEGPLSVNGSAIGL